MTKLSENSLAAKGFTLLEMLVVILLVSLLSGMLMQGFVYMASVYGVVERRQSAMQAQSLFSGWLHDSISGIVNGVDNQEFERFKFLGTESGFEAISLAPLVSQLYGQPHRIQWKLEQNGELVSLRYREVTIPGGVGSWHVIKEWRGVSARWLYLSEGEWVLQYPQVSLRFEERPAHVLPQAIALEVIGGRQPEIVVVALATDDQEYHPPEKPGL